MQLAPEQHYTVYIQRRDWHDSCHKACAACVAGRTQVAVPALHCGLVGVERVVS